MVSARRGYLLIADISGYTRYLNSSELEHAQGVLQSLLELLIDHTRPPLAIGGLEGDAVFSYGLGDDDPDGRLLIEAIEDTYVAFRRAIDLMVLNTTCDCNACANIGALDLKFFLHHGTYTTHRLHGRTEVVGPDVILIHRLLKNSITDATGIAAYTAYTAPAAIHLGLPDFVASLTPHAEEYDVGEVRMWIQDMHPVWEAGADALTVTIPPDDVLVSVSRVVEASPPAVWSVITDPDHRAVLLGVDRQELDRGDLARTGPGATYLCFHGGGRTTTQVILDWHPFEQLTTEDQTPIPATTVLVQFRLTEADGGTGVTIEASRARGPVLRRLLCNLLGKRVLARSFWKGVRAIEEMASVHALEVLPTSLEPGDISAAAAESLAEGD